MRFFPLSLRFILLTCCASLSLSGAPFLVVSTNTILQDFLSHLAPDSMETRCLMPADINAHSYEPSPGDVQLLSRADLVIANGLNLEPQLIRILKNSGFKGRLLIASDGVKALHGTHEHPGGGHHHTDPHAWLDLANVEIYVINICEALAELSPQDAPDIRSRTASYLEKIKVLDKSSREKLARIPMENRKLVLTHDSFGYFANAYGFRTIPIAGVTPGQEPNAQRLAQIIDLVRKENIRAIFTESTVNPRLACLIAEETRTELAAPLISDRIPEGKTFLQIYEDNVNAITEALAH